MDGGVVWQIPAPAYEKSVSLLGLGSRALESIVHFPFGFSKTIVTSKQCIVHKDCGQATELYVFHNSIRPAH
jgi:hypothetical protein